MTESISDLTHSNDSDSDPETTANGNPGRPQRELDIDDEQPDQGTPAADDVDR